MISLGNSRTVNHFANIREGAASRGTAPQQTYTATQEAVAKPVGKQQVIPENAPAEIKEAWNALSQEDKFRFSKFVLLETAEANMRSDRDGRVYSLYPQNQGYVANVMESPHFNFEQFIAKQVDRCKLGLRNNPGEAERYLKDMEILERFKELATGTGLKTPVKLAENPTYIRIF